MDHVERIVLEQKADHYLRTLTIETANRCVGSDGNRDACVRVDAWLAGMGLRTSRQEFACLDWRAGEASLRTADGAAFDVRPGPCSPGCQVRAPLRVCESVEAVEAVDEAGVVLLLRGEVAREALFPKNYPFVQFEEHQRIYRAVEAARPAAVAGATARSPDTAGAVYPVPLFDDGDFDIPSVYLTEEEGARLAAYAGEQVALEIDAQRTPATGWNPVATLGDPAGPEIVVFAHIDAKRGTPGAIDNAAGVVTLLLLAELLAGRTLRHHIEFVVLNGEDHYSAIGEITWMQAHGGFERIALGVNIDAAGYIKGESAWSSYGCPPALQATIERVLGAVEGLVPGEPWYQSDHSLFIQNGAPALALTSTELGEILGEIAHTEVDTPAIVDVGKLVTLALALRDLVLALE